MAKRKVDIEEFDTETHDRTAGNVLSNEAGTYKISLPFLPAMEIQAENAQQACELYNKFTGILKTINKYEVEKVN